jgi:hypothetical protein
VEFLKKERRLTMDHKQGTLDREKSAPGPFLYVAFELANSTWKMACSDGDKLRHLSVTSGDLAQVQRAIIDAKRHFGMNNKVHTVSCYELRDRQ